MLDKNIPIERKTKALSPQEFTTHVKAFESKFGCTLPDSVTQFLHQYGGCDLDAFIPILEPNPLADNATINTVFGFSPDDNSDSIEVQTNRLGGYPEFIPLASDIMGNLFFIYLGEDMTQSTVLFNDCQRRYFWDDKTFYNMFDNLHPKIVDYLDQRKKGLLPSKHEGFEDFYLVADTFDDFIANLQHDEYIEE